ncbi:MAG: hypothetical protein Q4B69_08340, partial [Slackia sp.]|nr:hypothetical protein [Slackia sp.]
VACELRERSIAEYIYDRLQPHLAPEEAQDFARDLQAMALDKLSQFGISQTDLEDMADMISEEIGAQARITSVTPVASGIAVAMPDGAEAPNAASRVEGDASSAVAPVAAEQKNPPAVRRMSEHPMRLSDLVGFDSAVEDVRALGIGVKE